MKGLAMHRFMLLAFAVLCAAGAQAQDTWPSRPIRIVVPFPAGGQLDVVMRLIAEKVSPALGQPVIIEPKPGADGNLATEQVAKSAPDGYTWLAASPPTTIQPSVRPSTLKYDPLRDFEPVALVGTSPFVFVVPASLPANTLDEFAKYAKGRDLSYAGSARGTVVHLATELFMHDADIKMVAINYPGQPSAIADLITGRVQFMTLGLILAEPQIKAGKLKALAILDRQRHRLLPSVPTVEELKFSGLVMLTWFGIAMPAKTPQAIVDRVNAEIMKVLAMPDVIEKLSTMGVDAARSNKPADFAAFMKDDVARWKTVVKSAGIETD